MLSSPLSSINTPKTLLDRSIEARSAGDIAQDTAIYLAASARLVEHSAISVNAEVYEGNLLVTGLMNDIEDCEPLKGDLERIDGVSQVHWHVLCTPRAEQRAQGAIGDFRRMVLRTKVGLRLLGDTEVADVNYRIAVDAQRNAVLLGRARSEAERAAAIRAAEGDGIHAVIAYIDVRP